MMAPSERGFLKGGLGLGPDATNDRTTRIARESVSLAMLDAEVLFYLAFFTAPAADHLFRKLRDTTAWQGQTKLCGMPADFPRLTVLPATPAPGDRHCLRQLRLAQLPFGVSPSFCPRSQGRRSSAQFDSSAGAGG